MKIAVLEPLGIPYEELKEKVEKAAGPDNEVVCYETREEDTPALIEEEAREPIWWCFPISDTAGMSWKSVLT